MESSCNSSDGYRFRRLHHLNRSTSPTRAMRFRSPHSYGRNTIRVRSAAKETLQEETESIKERHRCFVRVSRIHQ